MNKDVMRTETKNAITAKYYNLIEILENNNVPAAFSRMKPKSDCYE